MSENRLSKEEVCRGNSWKGTNGRRGNVSRRELTWNGESMSGTNKEEGEGEEMLTFQFRAVIERKERENDTSSGACDIHREIVLNGKGNMKR